ncbi:MAG: Hsp33 family molecular chaperone HslO [Oscillospiraceae bacterium]|nr:Hsp33 family molecular chaperone HslO [Oscillospiraceae bacterium]
MRDEIVRAITADGFVKAAAVTSTGIVERARNIHKTLPTATAALGRTLSAASMMGNMQKTEDGSLTLRISGGGPLGTILAVSDWQGNVRGYVQNPQISLLEKYRGKLDVGAAVGTDGTITVIRDLMMKQPYVGSVPLVSGEIAEDVTAYFAQSEQTPTACALGVLVNTDQSVRCAGGYLVQLLPGAPEEIIAKIEAGVKDAGSVTAMMDGGADAAGMLRTVLRDFEPEILETTPVEYRCSCTRERVERALVSLGKDELESMIREGKPIDTSCQFCDTVYHFTPDDLRAILTEATAP